MNDVTSPPRAPKAVPAPRDQHLRDMADCIRFLSMDAVQQAKSGHPGAPIGMADIATVLFRDFMQFDAAQPATRLKPISSRDACRRIIIS